MKFSPALRDSFPQLTEMFDDHERFLATYDGALEERFTPSGPPPPGLLDKALLARMSILQRARLLTLTMVHSANGQLSPGVFLSSRAHLEVTAMLGHLLWHVRRFARKNSAPEDLERVLLRLHLGRRTGLDTLPSHIGPNDVRAISVITYLESADKLLGELRADLQGIFKESYEWLSEFCHPNAFGRMTTGQELVGTEVVFYREPRISEDDLGAALEHAGLSHMIFFDVIDQELVALLAALKEEP